MAAASPATIAVATGATGGNGTYSARLLVTTDAARRWVTAATDTQDLTTSGAPACAPDVAVEVVKAFIETTELDVEELPNIEMLRNP